MAVTITAKMVKELRDLTGAGMMDCKKALEATEGDIEAAVDHLRKSGTAQAAKKSGRIAAEGSAFVHIDNNVAAIIEANCETDFVTKNETFQELLSDLAKHVVDHKPADMEEALQQKLHGEGAIIEDHINTMTATIDEKISFRRFELVTKTDDQVFGEYIHMDGSIGSLVVLEGTDDQEVAKDIAMHVAAINPTYISRDEVPEDEVNREKEILKTQALEEGKPENIVEMMVEGRLGKFFEDICLLEQDFVKDPDMTVKEYLDSHNATIKSFVRYEVGEGMEKREENFAEEVMGQINQ